MQKIVNKIYENIAVIRKISYVMDAVFLLYFVLLFYFVHTMSDSRVLLAIFVRVNPFTLGAYYMGLTAVVHLIAFKNVLSRALIWIVYLFVAVCSLVAIMGITEMWEFIIYVPHVIFILLGITVLIVQRTYAGKAS